MDENNRIRVSLGNGKYEYLTCDDIFNNSDSDDDYRSDDDEDFAAVTTNIDENFINNVIGDDDTETVETVNEPLDESANDDELFRLLENFDKICSDPNVLTNTAISSNGKINTYSAYCAWYLFYLSL